MFNWEWTEYFVFKMYPDVFAYYMFLLSVIIIAVFAHRYPSGRRFLHRRAWVRL
jgi:hypothetical protein